MAASTQNVNDYLDRAETIYESILVIAKRARILNQDSLNKRRDQEIFDDSEFLDQGMENESEENFVALQDSDDEKPVIIAQREFLNDELDYYYEAPKRRK